MALCKLLIILFASHLIIAYASKYLLILKQVISITTEDFYIHIFFFLNYFKRNILHNIVGLDLWS